MRCALHHPIPRIFSGSATASAGSRPTIARIWSRSIRPASRSCRPGSPARAPTRTRTCHHHSAIEGAPVRYLRRCLVALSGLLIPVAPASSQTVSGYTAPTEFMNLFFDFTGSNEAGYPAGQPTLGQMLTQSVIDKQPASAASAPLVLIVGSDIYVYDSGSGALLSHEQFRDDRSSGFFEMTAIS